MATRKRKRTTSRSALDDILGGIAGTTTRRRTRRPTVGGITGSKASSSIFLTIAAICFAVGYYLEGFEWLYIVGIALAIIYLIVAYFKNRKKGKAEPEEVESKAASPAGSNRANSSNRAASSSDAGNSSDASPASHLSDSQRAQIQDRLATHPELQQLHPRFGDAAKLVVHQHAASQESLTSLLKLSADEADAVLHQLELVGIVGAAQADGSRSVYVTGDDELSEWLKLIMEA